MIPFKFQIWKMSFPFLYFSLNIILFTVRVSSYLKTIFNIYKVFKHIFQTDCLFGHNVATRMGRYQTFSTEKKKNQHLLIWTKYEQQKMIGSMISLDVSMCIGCSHVQLLYILYFICHLWKHTEKVLTLIKNVWNGFVEGNSW